MKVCASYVLYKSRCQRLWRERPHIIHLTGLTLSELVPQLNGPSSACEKYKKIPIIMVIIVYGSLPVPLNAVLRGKKTKLNANILYK